MRFKLSHSVCTLFLGMMLYSPVLLAQSSPSEHADFTCQIDTVLIGSLNTDFKPQYQKQIAGLIPFKAGNTYSYSEIVRTIDNLKKITWLKTVDYSLDRTTQNSCSLNVQLEEYRTVRGIQVSGNYPFLSKQIKRLIPLQPGSLFEDNNSQASIQAIKDFFEKNGYYDSEVVIESKNHKRYPVVDIKIKIKKGHIYRYGQIDVTGNQKFSQSQIANKISRSSRYQDQRLKKDLKRVDRMYTKKNYIKSRISVDEKIFHEDSKTVDLKIDVRENKKLILTFSGHPSLSIATLRQVSKIYDSQSYDRFAVEQAQNRLEAYYKKSGFPLVKISPSIEKSEDSVFINFDIESGQRIQLSKLSFAGNKKITDKKISKTMLSQEAGFFKPGIYDEAIQNQDKENVKNAYLEEGYLDIQISEPEIKSNTFGDMRKVTYTVTEGKQYLVSDVEFYGLPEDSLLFAQKLPLRSNKPFNHKRFIQTEERILQNLFELGYAYAFIDSKIDKDASQATVKVTYTVQSGPKTYVRNVILKGNYKTKLSVLKQNLEFKSGDVFNYQKLLNSQLNLRRLGVFSTVKAEALGFENKSSQVDVLFELQEDKTFSTNFQLGYDNRNSVRSEINFTKRNFLGLAKEINTRMILGPYFNRIENTFIAPRIFGADLNLSNQYFAEYENAPAYNAYSYGSYLSTLKSFGSKWTLGVKEQISRYEVIESQSNVTALGNALFDNTLNEFRLFGYYDARDNFSDPQKGIYIYANNEINTELSNLDNNFNTIEIGVNHHKKILNRLTLNQSLRAGQIVGLTQSTIVPVNELFFLGGSDTLRGFEEDSIEASGGLVRLIYNAELHFKITGSIKLATFFDTGFLQDSWRETSLDDVRESAGFGLRYFTPVGPIRLDYGFALDRQNNEPKNRLHFSFGYFF